MKQPPSEKKLLRTLRRQARNNPTLLPKVLPSVDDLVTLETPADCPQAVLVYPSPGTLQRTGPLVHATLLAPDPLRQQRLKETSGLQTELRGLLLLDTGASETCISVEAAGELGLPQIDSRSISGVSGIKEHPVFLVEIRVDLHYPSGGVFTMNRAQPATGVIDLEASLRSIGLTTHDQWPARLVGLLGRDFLRHIVLIYDGNSARVRLVLNRKSLEQP